MYLKAYLEVSESCPFQILRPIGYVYESHKTGSKHLTEKDWARQFLNIV